MVGQPLPPFHLSDTSDAGPGVTARRCRTLAGLVSASGRVKPAPYRSRWLPIPAHGAPSSWAIPHPERIAVAGTTLPASPGAAPALHAVGLLSVETAEPGDALPLLVLRQSLEQWLESKGIEQWGRGEVSLSEIERQVADDEWRVVRGPDGLRTSAAPGSARCSARSHWAHDWSQRLRRSTTQVILRSRTAANRENSAAGWLRRSLPALRVQATSGRLCWAPAS